MPGSFSNVMHEIVQPDIQLHILDDLPIGVLVLREDFLVLFWNRSLEDWTGMPRSRILGTPIGDHFPHLNEPKYAGRLRNIFDGGPPLIFSAQLHRHIIPAFLPGGQPRIQHTTVTAIPAPDGASFHALFAIQDVTDLTHIVHDYQAVRDQALEEVAMRKQAEENLLASQARLQHLVASSPTVIYSSEVSGDYAPTFISENVTAQLGYDPQTFLEDPSFWAANIHPEDAPRVFAELPRLFEQGHHAHEYRFLHNDGAYRWMHDDLRLIQDEEGNPLEIVGSWIDIDARKQAEEALTALNETLEQRVAERTRELEASRATALAMMQDAEEARHRAEEAEAKYHELYDTAPDMFVSVDPHTAKIVQCNQAVADNLGYTKEEILGRPIFDMYHPDCKKEVEQAFATFTNTGAVHNAELQLKRKDGSKIEVILNVSSVRDEQGEILYSSSIWRDITERKRAEEALQESEERYRTLVEHAPEAIVVLDVEAHRFIDCNANAEVLYGLPREQLLQRGPVAVSPTQQPDGRLSSEVAHEQIQRAVEGTSPRFEWMHCTAEGVPIPCEVRLVRLPWTNRVLVRGSVTDITERKRAEAALQTSEQQLRLFVKHAPAAIAMFDRDMRYVQHSRRWLEDYGLVGQDIIDKSHYDVFPEILEMPHWLDIHQRCLKGAVERREEDRFDRPDGTTDWTRWEIHPWYEAEGGVGGIIMSTEVITERKQAEEEIRRLNEELEQRVVERTAQLEAANKELEAFSYSVSHDLRAPLRAIDGFSRILIQSHLDEVSPKGQHYLQRVRENTQRMGDLVDDLLRFSRLSRQPLAVKPVEPERLVRKVLKELHDMQEGRQVEIDIGALPGCQADPKLLEQVFVNLLSNALKYTQRREAAQIRIGAQNDGAIPVYFVADNGVGFDMRYADKLFGVFQRLHPAEDYEGTGVGLALVQRIIHRHGGEIWAEATPGEGAAFFFTLAEDPAYDG